MCYELGQAPEFVRVMLGASILKDVAETVGSRRYLE
jgi:hypothetical protein